MPCFHIREDLFCGPVPPGGKIVQSALNGGDIRRTFFRVIVGDWLHVPEQKCFVQKRQQKRFRGLTMLRSDLAQLPFLAARNFQHDCHVRIFLE
jgi:hypothetical protein